MPTWRGPKPKDIAVVSEIIKAVKALGLETCGTFGLLEDGMAEDLKQAGLDYYNHNLDPQPESVPINRLVKMEGTPLADAAPLDWTEFVHTIAVARITMPNSYVRLSAGRHEMPEAMQALCFMAGSNSIFYGEKLLTTDTPEQDHDCLLMQKLDLTSFPLN